MIIKNLQYTCSNGTTFKAERGDLSGGVIVTGMVETPLGELVADFAEFGAWHRGHIHHLLDGFSGYDCIKYSFEV